MKKHQDMVRRLIKPGTEILKTMRPEQAHQLHMVSSISGEAGELLDAFKKHIIYNKELDRENVIEELGDLEFYLEGLRQSLGITRATTLKHNLHKLNVRYSGGRYSDAAAKERKDKADATKTTNRLLDEFWATSRKMVMGVVAKEQKAKKPLADFRNGWTFHLWESDQTDGSTLYQGVGKLDGKIRLTTNWMTSRKVAIDTVKKSAKEFKP